MRTTEKNSYHSLPQRTIESIRYSLACLRYIRSGSLVGECWRSLPMRSQDIVRTDKADDKPMSFAIVYENHQISAQNGQILRQSKLIIYQAFQATPKLQLQ